MRAPDKPGITNLIDMLAAARGERADAIEREFDGQGYGALKWPRGVPVELLAPVRER